VTPISTSELEHLKAAALAEDFEWGESESRWYEGHLEGEFIVAQTDRAPLTDSTHEGLAHVRPTHTVQVGDHKYAIGKDRTFGVLFAHIDPDDPWGRGGR